MLTNLQLGFWNVLPSTQGKVWHVRPSGGSDYNPGDSPTMAFKTLKKALSAATANQNDIVLLYAENDTAASTTDYQSVTLDWNKDLVHLIGVASPTAFNKKARIANAATTVVSPVFKVSANNCIVANVTITNEYNNAGALLAAQVTGSGNYFKNVHFAGIAGGTNQSATNSADLSLTGASNTFDSCVLGVTSVARDADATNLLGAGAADNLFVDCIIQANTSANGYLFVTMTAMDGFLIFKRCLFPNAGTQANATFASPASGSPVLLMGCSTAAKAWIGAADTRVIVDMVAPTANAVGGIMVTKAT